MFVAGTKNNGQEKQLVFTSYVNAPCAPPFNALQQTELRNKIKARMYHYYGIPLVRSPPNGCVPTFPIPFDSVCIRQTSAKTSSKWVLKEQAKPAANLPASKIRELSQEPLRSEICHSFQRKHGPTWCFQEWGCRSNSIVQQTNQYKRQNKDVLFVRAFAAKKAECLTERRRQQQWQQRPRWHRWQMTPVAKADEVG